MNQLLYCCNRPAPPSYSEFERHSWLPVLLDCLGPLAGPKHQLFLLLCPIWSMENWLSTDWALMIHSAGEDTLELLEIYSMMAADPLVSSSSLQTEPEPQGKASVSVARRELLLAACLQIAYIVLTSMLRSVCHLRQCLFYYWTPVWKAMWRRDSPNCALLMRKGDITPGGHFCIQARKMWAVLKFTCARLGSHLLHWRCSTGFYWVFSGQDWNVFHTGCKPTFAAFPALAPGSMRIWGDVHRTATRCLLSSIHILQSQVGSLARSP